MPLSTKYACDDKVYLYFIKEVACVGKVLKTYKYQT